MYKHFFGTPRSEIEEKYAIRENVELNKGANEFFLIGFPGKVMRNIKIYELKGFNKWIKRIRYKKVKKLSTTIKSDEYLLVRTHSAETIPANKITARIDGNLVTFHFENNGMYGIHDKEYIEVKHDMYSFLHSYFKNQV